MTRFEQEISGALGEYWQKHAKQEVERLMGQSDNVKVEADGAIRWISSGNYVPEDCCEKLEYGGFKFSREATKAKREAQNAESIAEYRRKMANYKPSAEEMSEMRNAFGAGTTVVNVFTGQRFRV